MDTLKKIGCFFALCFAFVGIVGGIGYALYNKAYFIGVCLCLVTWMIYPKAKEFFEILMK